MSTAVRCVALRDGLVQPSRQPLLGPQIFSTNRMVINEVNIALR